MEDRSIIIWEEGAFEPVLDHDQAFFRQGIAVDHDLSILWQGLLGLNDSSLLLTH